MNELTVKLTKIKTDYGKSKYTLEFDVDDKIKSVDVKEEDLMERIRKLKELTGQTASISDVLNLLLVFVDEARKQKEPVPETYDLTGFIGVELEPPEPVVDTGEPEGDGIFEPVDTTNPLVDDEPAVEDEPTVEEELTGEESPVEEDEGEIP